jgi:cell division control protein 45
MDFWKMKMSTIKYKKSLKIPLLRHWSIWESMYYSTYLAPRLGIWKENEAGK